ncbi:MAG: glycosyltransferase [Planctomycetota bacterium]
MTGQPRKRLVVAQVITRLDRGGSADMAVSLCERLDRDRFELVLVTGPSGRPVEEPASLARRLDITVAVCPHLGREVRPWRDARALAAIRTYLGRQRPDVVHTHTSKAGALGRMAARLAGVPVVHSPHGHLFYGYYGRLGTGLVVAAERVLAPLARRVAVLTDTSREEHLARAIGRRWQYETVPSGADLRRYRPDDELRERVRAELGVGDAFVVGWAGRLSEVKGPDIFVEAAPRIAAEVPEAAFLVAGDGPLGETAEARAAELGVAERCRFLGHRDDLEAVLNACDVFLVTSRNEGLGLAAVEALACGVPVVAPAVGGLPELLERGESGVLVPIGEPRPAPATGPRGASFPDSAVVTAADGVARAVVRLALSPVERERLAAAGRKRSKRFDIELIVAHFADIYEQISRPGGGRHTTRC